MSARAASGLALLLALAHGCAEQGDEPLASRAGQGLAPHGSTVFDDTRGAFGLPMPLLREAHRAQFFVGNSFFNQNWVAAPASVASRDGLGPLFNARSCSGCHFKDGRSRPPESGSPLRTMLIRIGVQGQGPHGEALPDPTYGDQIQGDAVPGVPREADVHVSYEERAGTFLDGTPYSLRVPSYRLEGLGYGPAAPELLISPRVAPALIGLGLLEAVPESLLAKLTDADDANGDGISGRLQRVWHEAEQATRVGRFGWKAEQPTVQRQTAAAFVGDMGITSSLFQHENHSARESAALAQPNGGAPELAANVFDAVVLYARSLAVPAPRNGERADVQRGSALFEAAQCTGCHVETLHTGLVDDLLELSDQVIHPYTDLLLHDLGEGLSDGRPSYGADGREWRTAPLWGLGLIAQVNGHTMLLHDGRARGVSEAILWHDGEARPAQQAFVAMSERERDDLVAFVESL